MAYRALNLELRRHHHLLLIISLWSLYSLAQTTVLFGANPSLTDSDLKKQSQFSKGLNHVKSVITMAYEDF